MTHDTKKRWAEMLDSYGAGCYGQGIGQQCPAIDRDNLMRKELWHFSRCLSCNSVNEALWIDTENGYETETPCRYCGIAGQLERVWVKKV